MRGPGSTMLLGSIGVWAWTAIAELPKITKKQNARASLILHHTALGTVYFSSASYKIADFLSTSFYTTGLIARRRSIIPNTRMPVPKSNMELGSGPGSSGPAEVDAVPPSSAANWPGMGAPPCA